MKTTRVSICELSQLIVEFADTTEPPENLHSYLGEKLELNPWEVNHRIRSAIRRYPEWGEKLLNKGYMPLIYSREIPYKQAIKILDQLT